MVWTLTRVGTAEAWTFDTEPVFVSAENGWVAGTDIYIDVVGDQYVVTEVPPADAYVIDIPSFKMRFSPDQLLAIRACEDVRVRAFLTEIIDDQRTQNVNMALPYVQGAMLLLHGLGLIDADDVATILAPTAN